MSEITPQPDKSESGSEHLQSEARSESESIQQFIAGRLEVSQYTGPLPDPRILKAYEEVLPGAAERMFKLVESEQEHRHQMQKVDMEAQIQNQREIRSIEKRGQLFGFLIGIVVMAVVGTAALNDKEVTASILGIGGLTGLVSVFVLGRRKQEQEELDP